VETLNWGRYIPSDKYGPICQLRTGRYVTAGNMAKKTYACGIGPSFEVIGGKWKAVILWELRDGRLRFGELKRRVEGASEKVLIQQLRELERDKLITRHVYREVPPRVEYELAEWGHSLNAALAPMADWGEAYAKATGRYPAEPLPEQTVSR
jgi:DNA-binding HxlR family transcriptional regulator